MKRLLVLLILLLAVPAYAQQCSEDTQVARLTPALVGGGVPAAGGVCSAWAGQSQETENDYWGNSPAPLAQKIQVSSGSHEVCQVDAKLYQAGGLTTATWVKLCSSANCSTGCSDQSISTNVVGSTPTVYSFTWASNPSVSSDFFLCILESTNGFAWRAQTNSNSYIDTTYDSYRNQSDINGDFYFVLYKVQ